MPQGEKDEKKIQREPLKIIRFIGETNRGTRNSGSHENPCLSHKTTFISTSRCNQRAQQAQIKNRSDDDYWNLSDNDSHKVK